MSGNDAGRTRAGWWQRLRRAPDPAERISDDEWRACLARSALFTRLVPTEAVRLREFAARFLAQKSFSGAADFEPDAGQRLIIAALACLPVMHLGYDWLCACSGVIVYPGGFRVRREHHDEHSGVVTEGDDELIGEAWERGPVVLSWADIERDLLHPFDGFNVVIHEIAHTLDMLDGAIDGMPKLPAAISRREWVEAMQPAYDALVRDVEGGRDTLIDPYAAESVDEYFAVTSELHFSDPATLLSAAPAVASLLQRFYAGGAATPTVAAARSAR